MCPVRDLAAVKTGTLHHKAWWHLSDKGLNWLCRPWCWVLGYHRPHHCDVHFELCWFCQKRLWSRSRDGGCNPFIKPTVNRAPATWRHLALWLRRQRCRLYVGTCPLCAPEKKAGEG